MLKANTTIMVGGKRFQAGQTVSGLSKMDREWMLKAGYITEKEEEKEKKEKGRPAAQEKADG